MIGLMTDSNAQLPPLLRDRFSVGVVPLTIVIDGTAYLEGIDLDPTEFLDRMRSGAVVSTAAPSPGQFVQAYRDMAASGAECILSVHVGERAIKHPRGRSGWERPQPGPRRVDRHRYGLVCCRLLCLGCW